MIPGELAAAAAEDLCCSMCSASSPMAARTGAAPGGGGKEGVFWVEGRQGGRFRYRDNRGDLCLILVLILKALHGITRFAPAI